MTTAAAWSGILVMQYSTACVPAADLVHQHDAAVLVAGVQPGLDVAGGGAGLQLHDAALVPLGGEQRLGVKILLHAPVVGAATSMHVLIRARAADE